ncbi:MAG: hypothetical protein KJ674_01570 [Nanoarchaeota archaeon]|nr:hypothetical protein [Nanoarchaeota archaeon]
MANSYNSGNSNSGNDFSGGKTRFGGSGGVSHGRTGHRGMNVNVKDLEGIIIRGQTSGKSCGTMELRGTKVNIYNCVYGGKHNTYFVSENGPVIDGRTYPSLRRYQLD